MVEGSEIEEPWWAKVVLEVAALATVGLKGLGSVAAAVQAMIVTVALVEVELEGVGLGEAGLGEAGLAVVGLAVVGSVAEVQTVVSMALVVGQQRVAR